MGRIIIDGREVVVLGDTTTHGGKVVTASANVYCDGIEVARVGDMVSCPRCGGTHAIVSGSDTVFNNNRIARHGDKVACGSTLISGSESAAESGGPVYHSPLSEGLGSAFADLVTSWFRDETEYPGRGRSPDETCRHGKEILNYPGVLETIKGIIETSDKNKWEYSAWIRESMPGQYRVTNIRTDKLRKSVDAGPMPEDAVAHIHTHVDEAPNPSSGDIAAYKRQNPKPYVNYIVGPSIIVIVDDIGEVACTVFLEY